MTTYLIRIEGVNLRNFIYDVNELSVVRGGSFLLLDAVTEVQNRFGLEPISTGASAGLFRVPTGKDHKQIVSDVRAHLAQDSRLKHATFVVNAVEESEFIRTRESLLALNRWSQMTAPSLALPEQTPVADSCELDLVRPAVATIRKADRTHKISESVVTRRNYGIDRKKNFYEDIAGVTIEAGYANEFEELTECVGQRLSGKMAVLHFDGNKFGKIQRKKCPAPEPLTDFDNKLKSLRKTFLSELLKTISSAPPEANWLTHDRKGRIETLLWGGDEFTLVVPAWQGWNVIAQFFHSSQSWAFEGIPLTHCAGVVFCNHKAPIHRIRRLAENLTNLAKEVNKNKELDQQESAIAYQVLESFDNTGISVERLRDSIAKKFELTVDELRISARGFAESGDIAAIAKVGPRLPMHKLRRAWDLSWGEHEDQQKKSAELFTALDEELKKDTVAHPLIERIFGTGRSRWFHLLELWDYLGITGSEDD